MLSRGKKSNLSHQIIIPRIPRLHLLYISSPNPGKKEEGEGGVVLLYLFLLPPPFFFLSFFLKQRINAKLVPAVH
jgi:hypothetical protein